MKRSLSVPVLLVFVVIAFACQPPPSGLTDAQKAAIADSAKTVAKDVARGIQNLDGPAVLARYSSAPDARFIENGFVYESYAAFKDSLYADFATFDSLSPQIDALDVVVLGAEAAAATESFHFTGKTKDGDYVDGQGVISIIVQQRAGRWQIVQSHESELPIAESDATPAPANQKPAKKM